MNQKKVSMEDIVSLCKRRGFIYPGSEVYGGLSGTFDYGPLGVALKKNIENLWWKRFVLDREDMYGVDAAILMNKKVWESSGHVAGFSDPLTEDTKTGKRYRADHILEEKGLFRAGMTIEEMTKSIKEHNILSPEKNKLGEVRQFNMMLKTQMGPVADEHAISYLRPETAQGMFVNFKNVLDTFHPKLPFGLAQIGKAFRNEIAPRDFVFRVRELEQMEIEYFVHPATWQESFEHFRLQMHAFMKDIGLSEENIHELEVADGDRAHYSLRTIDFEYDFPFGKKELYGLAYRTDFDLKAHSKGSGTELSYFDDETKERFIPHCIEPSFGVGRTLLAVLTDAYREDVSGESPRVYVALPPKIAPVLCAISPLLKNKEELTTRARELFVTLKKQFGNVMYDDNGNIGKRYRRQDEIGTPFCVVVDFETIDDETVTIRYRDTGKQKRVSQKELFSELTEARI